MKKLLIIALLLVVSLSASAQKDANTIFSNFKGKKGVTSVEISSLALDLTSGEMSNDDKELKEAIHMIDNIKILQTDEPKQANTFFKALRENFDNNVSISPFMSLENNKEELNFYLQKNNNKIKDLILLIGEDSTSTMISIQGDDIKIKKLKKLTENLDIKGFDKLDSID